MTNCCKIAYLNITAVLNFTIMMMEKSCAMVYGQDIPKALLL